ncbi:hypothetical protein ACFXOD_34330 [Streptomyces sp. NPDC059161]|uniref:hypothetical protein n=1 Tax=Streptomyces sp. NPDC059161 TaxID=3346749 RepID=UPI003679AC69
MRVRIEELTRQLGKIDAESENLRITRKTLLTLPPSSPAAEPAQPDIRDHPAYRHILTALADVDKAWGQAAQACPGVCPDAFSGVEVWGVYGEAERGQPGSLVDQLAHGGIDMTGLAASQHNDVAAELPVGDAQWAGEVLLLETSGFALAAVVVYGDPGGRSVVRVAERKEPVIP